MIKKILLSILALIGFFTLLIGCFLWIKISPHMPGKQLSPSRLVLEVDLTKPVYESPSFSFIGQKIQGPGYIFDALISKLYKAAEDPKVKSLIIKVGSEQMGIAQIQELRQALHHLRRHGKFIYAFGESFEGASGTRVYYLASACDYLVMQPIGSLSLTGLSLEVPFLKPLFDKYGIKPEFEKREDYKSFPEIFTESDFTSAHREALQSVLDEIYKQILEDIGKDQNRTAEGTKVLFEKSPYRASEALEHRLIHQQGFLDEVQAQALEKAGKGATLLSLERYMPPMPSMKDARVFKVALVHGVGTIQSSLVGGSMGRKVLSSQRMHRIFKQIRAQKDVHAVVLRLDTEGGAAPASEFIWREIVKLQENGIPVIISMGNMAASGGYLLSASAHTIFADRGSITGSIGVFSGKFVTKGAWEQLGVKWGALKTGPHSLMWGSGQEFTPEEKEKISYLTDATYDRFLTVVSDGRHLSKEQVQKAAKGRIWTGQQAKELGLVDELGGLHEALEYAKKQISGVDSAQIVVQRFPRPKTLFEQILILVGLKSLDEETDFNLGFEEIGDQIIKSFATLMKDPLVFYSPLFI